MGQYSWNEDKGTPGAWWGVAGGRALMFCLFREEKISAVAWE